MVEPEKVEQRKSFMKRNKQLNIHYYFLAQFEDPMKKREEFSVNLRK
jgi:hypothetical protein